MKPDKPGPSRDQAGTKQDEAGQVEVTPEMIAAGIEALNDWRSNAEFVSERRAVIEIYQTMTECQAIPSGKICKAP